MNNIQKSLLGAALLVAFAVYSGSVILGEIDTATQEAAALTTASSFVGPFQQTKTFVGSQHSTKLIKAPSELNASLAGTSIANITGIGLKWTDNSDNENGFWINRASSTDGMGARIIARLSADTTSFLDKNVTEGETYSYRVRVTASSATSTNVIDSPNVWSNWATLSVPPARISSIKVYEGANSTDAKPVMHLSWVDNSKHETGYRVYRATGSALTLENRKKLADLPQDAVKYDDATLKINTEYTYQVCVVGSSGIEVCQTKGGKIYPEN